jgi:hypothetical protein
MLNIAYLGQNVQLPNCLIMGATNTLHTILDVASMESVCIVSQDKKIMYFD